MRLFHCASDEEIKQGKTTDIYFERTMQILKAKNKDKIHVVAEVTTGSLPENWPWGILCGIEEVANLFQGYPVNVYAMQEGPSSLPMTLGDLGNLSCSSKDHTAISAF